MNAVKSGEYLETIVLARLRRATPDNMSEAVLKARERHGKPFSYEPRSTWKPHDTPVLTAWLQSKGEKK